jgi:hypothetical protein
MFAIAIVPFLADDRRPNFCAATANRSEVEAIGCYSAGASRRRPCRPTLVDAGFCTLVRAVLDVWAMYLSLVRSQI